MHRGETKCRITEKMTVYKPKRKLYKKPIPASFTFGFQNWEK